MEDIQRTASIHPDEGTTSPCRISTAAAEKTGNRKKMALTIVFIAFIAFLAEVFDERDRVMEFQSWQQPPSIY